MTEDAYSKAGVNITAGNNLIDRIGPAARNTARSGTSAGLGGFGALFDIKAAGYKDPILVSTTDGVGTKLKIAIEINRLDSIGTDLVAMCVNDLVVQGADPLFFLDYYASGKLDVDAAEIVINGIATACKEAGCSLVGGETAEMPGMYMNKDFDLAGFAVGAVERNRIIDGSKIKVGDIILGLGSNGLHSNGFSLVRNILAEVGLSYLDKAPYDYDRKIILADELLKPTRIYVRACLAAAATGRIKACAHITGGGLIENIPRILPKNLAAEIYIDSWKPQTIFTWLQKMGNIPVLEMIRIFNYGIGMVAVVDPSDVEYISELFKAAGERIYKIGSMVPGQGMMIIKAGQF
jgi:phosphoribosylformylglycinamidine cyclo-ligase